MRNTLIAKRYAKALFDFALEQNMLEPVKKDLELVISTLKNSKDLRLMLKSPVIKAATKEAVIREIFEKHIQKPSIQYLSIIIRKRRETFIEGIAEEFINLYKKFKNIVTTHLETAVTLDDDIRRKFIDLMSEQTGGEIELIEDVRKEIIGGFVMHYDDKKYDASIQRQLADLKKEFKVNLYERKL